MSLIEYFAFGSNMNPARMKDRLSWEPQRRIAILSDYQLIFDKVSNDGGKANIRPLEGSIVEGILYLLNEKDLVKLDGFEGVAAGHYVRELIQVKTETEDSLAAMTYIALKTGLELPPTREYLDHLLAGKDLLSSQYIEKLSQIYTLS